MAIDLYEMRTAHVGQWVRLPDGKVGKLVDDDEAYYVNVNGCIIEVPPTTWVEFVPYA